MSTYNGWTNYATWRVALEFFDGCHDFYKNYTSQDLQDCVEEMLSEGSNQLASNYALAFISEVNWHEISSHIQEQE